MPEFSLYSSVLFLHVAAALILVATGMFAPLILHRVRVARTLAEMETWILFERRSSSWNPAAAFVLLGTGVYMGSAGFWTQGWFLLAVAAWIATTALAVGVVGRMAAALHAGPAAPPDAPVPAALDAVRWSTGWTAANASMLANDLAMFYVMFNKPELVASTVLLVFANLAAVAIALTRHTQAASRRRAGALV